MYAILPTTPVPLGLDTHQWTKLHHQQVGSDLSALSQTLHQSVVLEVTGEEEHEIRSRQKVMTHIISVTCFKNNQVFESKANILSQ